MLLKSHYWFTSSWIHYPKHNACSAKYITSLIICMLLSLLRQLSALQCPQTILILLYQDTFRVILGLGAGGSYPQNPWYPKWSLTCDCYCSAILLSVCQSAKSYRPPITHPLAQSEFWCLSTTTSKIQKCEKEQSDKELIEIKVVTKTVKHLILP